MRRLDFPEKKLLGNMSDATVKSRRQALEEWVNALLSARLGAVPTLLRARAAVVVWLNSERGLGGLQHTSSRDRSNSDGVPAVGYALVCSELRACLTHRLWRAGSSGGSPHGRTSMSRSTSLSVTPDPNDGRLRRGHCHSLSHILVYMQNPYMCNRWH